MSEDMAQENVTGDSTGDPETQAEPSAQQNDAESSADQNRGPAQAEPPSHQSEELTEALESTLEDLTQSITRMEAIIRQLESGGADWDESVRLISEANELAISSSQRLDRAVQDVVYGSSDAAGDAEEGSDRQESLDLP